MIMIIIMIIIIIIIIASGGRLGSHFRVYMLLCGCDR